MLDQIIRHRDRSRRRQERAREWVAAACGKRRGNAQRSLIEAPSSNQRHRRLGQRAGLVEYDCIYIGQALQRGRRFQQHAGTEQPAGGDHLHHRHRKRQCAGTGNDQHRARGQQRLTDGYAGGEVPPQEGQQRRDVHGGRVAACHAIGEHHKARTSRLGGVDKPRAFGEQRTIAGGGRTYRQRHAEIERAGKYLRPRRRGDRQAFAGDETGIEQRCAALDHAIDADPLTQTDQHLSPGTIDMLAATFGAAVGSQHRDVRGTQRQQLLGGGARLAAGAMVQHAADQQEEQQRDC